MNLKMKVASYFICVCCTLISLLGCDFSTKKESNSAAIITVNEDKLDPDYSNEPTPLKQVILTLGSWRKDDVKQINHILKEFTLKHPHIVIKYDPTEPAQYNDVIQAQLEGGSAPDLFYLRSHKKSEQIYAQGHLVRLNSIDEISSSFSPEMRAAWTASNGDIYGVPLMAVSHGIYYNIPFFEENHFTIPNTWEELLLLASEIKQMGITPFANTTGDSWAINGLILQNILPGFIGGEKGRLEYYNGERCYNDPDMLSAFQALKDISGYIADNQMLLTYADSLQLFLQGKSPMLFSGSWDIPFFEEQDPSFEWSAFAIPPPQGKDFYVTFHPDAGIGLNSASLYKKEAEMFLRWITTKEFAELYQSQLPGFFSMRSDIEKNTNKHAAPFLEFNNKYKTDMRMWRQIGVREPSDYTLSVETSTAVVNGVMTPQEAVNRLQEGIASWYAPARQCIDE